MVSVDIAHTFTQGKEKQRGGKIQEVLKDKVGQVPRYCMMTSKRIKLKNNFDRIEFTSHHYRSYDLKKRRI